MEKEQKEYEKAAQAFEKAVKTSRLIQAKIEDLNKKICKGGMARKDLEKSISMIDKWAKDLHKCGKAEDKAHADMEKALEKLQKAMS